MDKYDVSVETIKEVRDRFTNYQNQLDELIKSIENDKIKLHPPFSGADSDDVFLKTIVDHLEKSKRIIDDYIPILEKSLDSVVTPESDCSLMMSF